MFKYQLIEGNPVMVEQASMEEPDKAKYQVVTWGFKSFSIPQCDQEYYIELEKYEKHIAALRTYPVTGPHNFIEGESYEEGKDFEVYPQSLFYKGNYMNICAVCKNEIFGVDKLWFMCEPCCNKPVVRQIEQQTTSVVPTPPKENEASGEAENVDCGDLKEYIICAAIYVKDGLKHEHQPRNIDTGFVIGGRRHHNCYYTLSLMGERVSKLMVGREGQGFITNKNRYVDRKKGFQIASAANQLLIKYHEQETPILISEDLY